MRALKIASWCAFGASLVTAQEEAGDETEKRTQRIVEGINTTAKQTRSMLQSLLLANSQSMFSVTQMQKSIETMKKALEDHGKDLEKCHLELKEMKSAQKQASQTWIEQNQINSAESLLQIQTEIKKQEKHLMTSRQLIMAQLETHHHSTKVGSSASKKKAAIMTVERSNHKNRLAFLQREKQAALVNDTPVMTEEDVIAEHGLQTDQKQKTIVWGDEALAPFDKIDVE